MLQEEQITQIKQQLIEQVNATFPEDKKQLALEQIDSMDAEQLEEFLIQNNLIKEGEDSQQKCVFCSIIEGKTPTNKIEENEQAIATLEINPISKAHTIIIPKLHLEDAPKKAFELTQEISERIKRLFNPKDIKIYTSKLFGHEIINVLPIYKNETQESKRKKADQKELQKIQKQLQEIKTLSLLPADDQTKKEKQEIISDQTHWLPRRKP